MKAAGIITLITDFGLSDPYAGIMKGVILTINPHAGIIDISHQIKMGHITQAAYFLLESYRFFPKGTVHIAVVDPGVGGGRRPILLETQNHFFVGPDNGLFWPIIRSHQQIKIIHLTERKYFLSDVSHTFHGRDIFASVAAHLSGGIDPLKMGTAINDPVSIKVASPEQKKNILSGQVIHVDHFGNLITNIHRKALEQFLGGAFPIIMAGTLKIDGMLKTYMDTDEGMPLALIGSSDCVEIAVNLGRACDHVDMDSEDIIGIKVEVGKG